MAYRTGGVCKALERKARSSRSAESETGGGPAEKPVQGTWSVIQTDAATVSP
jgi:hypothetical protein